MSFFLIALNMSTKIAYLPQIIIFWGSISIDISIFWGAQFKKDPVAWVNGVRFQKKLDFPFFWLKAKI